MQLIFVRFCVICIISAQINKMHYISEKPVTYVILFITNGTSVPISAYLAENVVLFGSVGVF